MDELVFDQFERVKPLVHASGVRTHLTFVYSVLEGRHPGKVFVDSAANPRTALFCNLTGFYFAFGEPVKEQVWPLVAEWVGHPITQEYTVLFAPTPAWDDLFSRQLSLVPEPRKGFEFDPERSDFLGRWREAVPTDFSVQPITEELAQSIVDGTGTANYGIDPWFVRMAGGPRAYAAENLGLALVKEGQIASICGYCALGHGEAEMEVGTVPEHRGKGFASVISAAFIEQCRAKSWLPAYTCTTDNFASIGVARKLGFVEVEELPGYRLN